MSESEDLIYWDEDGNAFSVPRNESARHSNPDAKRSHTLNPCPSQTMDDSDIIKGRDSQTSKRLNSSVTEAFVKNTEPTSRDLSQTPRASKTTLSKESQETVTFTHTKMVPKSVPRGATHSTAVLTRSDDFIFQHCLDSDSGASTQFMEMEEQLTGVVMECSKGGGNSSGSTSTSVSLHSASIPTLSTMPHLLHTTPLPAPALPVVSTVAGCKRKADASQLQQAPSLETLPRSPITNTCSADDTTTATNTTNTTAATTNAVNMAPSPVTPIITTTPALHTSTNATAHPTTANITIQITTPSTLITPTQPTSPNTTSTNTMHNTEVERQRAAELEHLERVLGNPQVCARLQPAQLAALRDRLMQLLLRL